VCVWGGGEDHSLLTKARLKHDLNGVWGPVRGLIDKQTMLSLPHQWVPCNCQLHSFHPFMNMSAPQTHCAFSCDFFSPAVCRSASAGTLIGAPSATATGVPGAKPDAAAGRKLRGTTKKY
jgi:hypothetical protein